MNTIDFKNELRVTCPKGGLPQILTLSCVSLLMVIVFFAWWLEENTGIRNSVFFLLALLPINLLSLLSLRELISKKTNFAILISLIFLLLTIIWTPDLSRGILILVSLYSMFSLGNMISKLGLIEKCMKLYICACMSVIFLAIFLTIINSINIIMIIPYLNTNSMGYWNANELSFIFSFSTLCVWFLNISKLKKICFTIILVAAVIILGSRGALFSLFCSGMLSVLSTKLNMKITKIPYLILVMSICSLFYNGLIKDSEQGYVQYEEVSLDERYVRAFSGDLGMRDLIWANGFNALMNDPYILLFGTGIGAVDRTIAEGGYMAGTVKEDKDGILRIHSHNAYLEWFMAVGLFGLPSILIALVRVFYVAGVLDVKERTSFRISLITFVLLFSNSGVPFLSLVWPLVGGIILSLMLNPSANMVTEIKPSIHNNLYNKQKKE